MVAATEFFGEEDEGPPSVNVLEMVAKVAGYSSREETAWHVIWTRALRTIAADASPLHGTRPRKLAQPGLRTLPPARPMPGIPPPVAVARRYEAADEVRLPEVVRSESAKVAKSKKQGRRPGGGMLNEVGPQPALPRLRRDAPPRRPQSENRGDPAPQPDGHHQHAHHPAKASATLGGHVLRQGGRKRIWRAEREKINRGGGLRNKSNFRPVRGGKHGAAKLSHNAAKLSHNANGDSVLLRDMLDDVSRQKKEKLLEMLLDIEEDLAESPLDAALPHKVPPKYHR